MKNENGAKKEIWVFSLLKKTNYCTYPNYSLMRLDLPTQSLPCQQEAGCPRSTWCFWGALAAPFYASGGTTITPHTSGALSLLLHKTEQKNIKALLINHDQCVMRVVRATRWIAQVLIPSPFPSLPAPEVAGSGKHNPTNVAFLFL